MPQELVSLYIFCKTNLTISFTFFYKQIWIIIKRMKKKNRKRINIMKYEKKMCVLFLLIMGILIYGIL